MIKTSNSGIAAIRKKLKDSVVGWIFVLPLVIGLALFTIYPVLQSLIYSFHRYNNDEYTLIGFGNFINIFTLYWSDTRAIFGNTFLYAIITIPLNLVLSYFVAITVSQKIKGVTFFRVLYYLPVVIPGVISGVIWAQMFNNTQAGLFNSLFMALGMKQPFTFFASNSTALFSAIVMNFWSLGASMILWLSAFRNIPNSLYEAAKIDGAGTFNRFAHITVPLSTPMIFYNLVTGLIGALQNNSSMVYGGSSATEGGSLYFIAVAIYYDGLKNYNYGYAAALAWVLFIIIAILTAFTFLTNKWVYTGDGE